MAYKVVSDFKDLAGDGHVYKVGDVYPHAGKADVGRVVHLMTPTAQRGALIVEVAEPAKRSKKKED